MKLRFDGVYSYSFFVHGVNEMKTKFLRFYPDGTLIYVVIPGMITPSNYETPTIPLYKINRWFRKEEFLEKKGRVITSYTINKDEIFFDFEFTLNKFSFTRTPEDITWSYKGTINKDSQLILINIGQHKDTSDFYKMLEYKKGDKFVEIEYNFNECEVT